jgi:hypothetical protein
MSDILIRALKVRTVEMTNEQFEMYQDLYHYAVELEEKVKTFEQIFGEIINHKEVFGYTPTSLRCIDLAKKALELYKE